MLIRRISGYALPIAMTLPFAVLAHVAIDIVAGHASLEELLEGHHIYAMALALCSLVVALRRCGVGFTAAEARRRRALDLAALRANSGPRVWFAVIAAQAALAGLTVAAEGVMLDPAQLVTALACAAVALLAGAATYELTRSRLCAFAIALVQRLRRPGTPKAALHARPARRAAAVAAPFHLVPPNRPPPSFLTFASRVAVLQRRGFVYAYSCPAACRGLVFLA